MGLPLSQEQLGCPRVPCWMQDTFLGCSGGSETQIPVTPKTPACSGLELRGSNISTSPELHPPSPQCFSLQDGTFQGCRVVRMMFALTKQIYPFSNNPRQEYFQQEKPLTASTRTKPAPLPAEIQKGFSLLPHTISMPHTIFAVSQMALQVKVCLP